MIRLLFLVLLLLGASACGQKGSLYLPERESSTLHTHSHSAKTDFFAQA